MPCFTSLRLSQLSVEADSYEDILLAVVDRLRALKGIKSTVTDLVLE